VEGAAKNNMSFLIHEYKAYKSKIIFLVPWLEPWLQNPTLLLSSFFINKIIDLLYE